MAKLSVKKQLLFGGSLTPTGNIAQFGSLAAAAPAYSGDPATIQSLAAWLNGLAAALINAPNGLASPALEDLNGLFYVLTYQLAYLKQAGLAEWDATVTYYIGSWAQNGAGIPYVSLTDNNTNNILTDTNNWTPLKSTLVQGQSTCKAWVTFDGFTGTIRASSNVSAVTRNATGSYVLTFPVALADANYAWSGSCGTTNAGSPGAGDNNSLVGGPPGKTVIKTTTQLSVFAWESRNQVCEDPSEVTVMIFGN
jgi:hypothetical protein